MSVARWRSAAHRSAITKLVTVVASVVMSAGSLTAIAPTAAATPSGGPASGRLTYEYASSNTFGIYNDIEQDVTWVSATMIAPGDPLKFEFSHESHVFRRIQGVSCLPAGVFPGSDPVTQAWPVWTVRSVAPGQVGFSTDPAGISVAISDGSLATQDLGSTCSNAPYGGYNAVMWRANDDRTTVAGTIDTTALATGCYELGTYIADPTLFPGVSGTIARFSVGGVDCGAPHVRLHLHVAGAAASAEVSFVGVITGPLRDGEVGDAIVEPGLHKVTLADPDKWTVTGGTCDDPGSTVATGVTGGPTYNVAANRTVTCDVSVSPVGADLQVTKTLTSATPLTVDGRATYSIEVTNLGSQAAVDVVLTDTPDARLQPQSAVASTGTCVFSSTSVTCHLGGLAVDASAVVSVVMDVLPGNGDAAVNQASVTSTTPDPNPSNNTSIVTSELDPDCATGGTRAVITPAWDARVKVPHFPDADLFNFAPTFAYCYDGQVADIISASVLGTADSGLDEAVLSGLGFATAYNPDKEEIITRGGFAQVTGDFEFTFQPTVLLDKLGVKSAVEKLAAKRLTKGLAKIIKNKGYNDEFRYAVADFAATTFKRTHDEYEKALKNLTRALPNKVAKQLTDWVLGKVDAQLANWQAKVTASLSAGNFANWTAEQIAGDLVAKLMAELEEATLLHFSVWTPIVGFEVSPDGSYRLRYGGFANPFLAVSQVK